MRLTAAIIAVGTEITSGQTLNRNASWLATKLTDLGFEVRFHEAVPDDHALIVEALRIAEKMADHLFVTGGLGPTSDDFTRDLVTEWCGHPARFDEPTWKLISERLMRFRVPVVESQRQQCYFPEGARILANSAGISPGFTVKKGETTAWIFPGPPRELAAVFTEQVEPELKSLIPSSARLRLFTWDCLGKSEAELGELTEAAVKGEEGSRLLTGYREHSPYVEIKIWCPEPFVSAEEPALARLEAALAPWIVAKHGEDLARAFLSSLAAPGTRDQEVEVIDAATAGFLGERLAPLLRSRDHASVAARVDLITEWTSPTDPAEWVATMLDQADPEALTFVVAGPTPDGRWSLGLRDSVRTRVEERRSPFGSSALRDRVRQTLGELALKEWTAWFNSNSP